MNFNDYEALWRAQVPPAPPSVAERAAVFERVRRESLKFDRTIFWRDMRELLVAGILAVDFAFAAWNHTDAGYIAWSRWLALVLVLLTMLGLLRDRRNMPRPPDPEASLVDQIETALAGLRHQARVLRRVPWDYALPLCLAMVASASDPMIRQGGVTALWSAATVSNICLAFLVGALVVWLNRFALRRTLLPKIADLEKLRDELAADER